MAIDLPGYDTQHSDDQPAPLNGEPTTTGADTPKGQPNGMNLGALDALGLAVAVAENEKRKQRYLRVLRTIGVIMLVLSLFGIYGLLALFGLLPTLVDY